MHFIIFNVERRIFSSCPDGWINEVFALHFILFTGVVLIALSINSTSYATSIKPLSGGKPSTAPVLEDPDDQLLPFKIVMATDHVTHASTHELVTMA